MDNNLNYGFLTVNVTTASGALPIVDATVTVSQLTDGKDTPFAILQTDSDGRTDRILLPAPPQSNSLTPTPIGPGYSLYNIEVEKEGYYTSNYLNVPIFPGITSIQPVKLIPTVSGYTLKGDHIVPPVTEGEPFGLSETNDTGRINNA